MSVSPDQVHSLAISIPNKCDLVAIPRRVALKKRLLGQFPIESFIRRTQGKSASCSELMKNDWHMKEIDEMDMLGFLRLRAWDATREQEKKKPRQRLHSLS